MHQLTSTAVERPYLSVPLRQRPNQLPAGLLPGPGPPGNETTAPALLRLYSGPDRARGNRARSKA